MVRDTILVMELIDWFVLIPLAITALLTRLVMSLGTPWGLFKHYWVLFTLLLGIFGIFVSLEYLLTLRQMGVVASRSTLSSAELAMLKDPGHAVHNIGGIGLLLSPGA